MLLLLPFISVVGSWIEPILSTGSPSCRTLFAEDNEAQLADPPFLIDSVLETEAHQVQRLPGEGVLVYWVSSETVLYWPIAAKY